MGVGVLNFRLVRRVRRGGGSCREEKEVERGLEEAVVREEEETAGLMFVRACVVIYV